MSSDNTSNSHVHLTDQDKSNREISAIYFTVISVFIALGNIGTICVVWMKKRKKPTDHLLRALAVVDMVTPFCQFSPGIFYSLTGVWKGGQVSCSLVVLVSLVFLRFSMIVSTLIAIDRFLAIAKPFFYRSKVRLGPIKVIFIIGGIYSSLIALFPVLDLNYDNDFDNDWWRCIYHWKTSRSPGFTRIHIIANLIDSLICVLIVTICNIGVIVYFVQRRRKNTLKGGPNIVSKDSSSSSSDSRRKKDVKYAKMMGLVMLYVPLYILPTQILIILQHFNLTSLRAETVCLYQMHITGLTLLCNLIFYALIRKHYRHAYAFLLRHPMVLCGAVSSHGVFDFDEGPDSERTLNFRQMAVVSLAAARFRQNLSHRKKARSKVEHADWTVAKDIPAIVEDIERKHSSDSTKTNQKRRHDVLWDNSLSSSFLQPMPSTSSYFSDQESLPSSPIWLRTPSRSRGQSCGSEATELSEFDATSFQNSPHSKLSFEFEGFDLNTIECQQSTSKQCQPVQKEGSTKSKMKEMSLQCQRLSFEYEVFELTTNQETIKHSLPLKSSFLRCKRTDRERNSMTIQLSQDEVFEHNNTASQQVRNHSTSIPSENLLVRKRAESDTLTRGLSHCTRRQQSLNENKLFQNCEPQVNSRPLVNSAPLYETSRLKTELPTIQRDRLPLKSNSEDNAVHECRRTKFRRGRAVSDIPVDWVLK